MQNEAHPLPVGTTGTVVFSDQLTHQIFVDWDIDRSLILLTEDPFTVIDHNQGVS